MPVATMAAQSVACNYGDGDPKAKADMEEKLAAENPFMHEGDLLGSGVGDHFADGRDDLGTGVAAESSSASSSTSDSDDSHRPQHKKKLPPLGPPLVFVDVPCAQCGQIMGQMKHVPRIGARREKMFLRSRPADGVYQVMGPTTRSRYLSCHDGDIKSCIEWCVVWLGMVRSCCIDEASSGSDS